MTKETESLAEKINAVRTRDSESDMALNKGPSGYQIVTEIIVDLFGCVLIGASLGIVFQNLFDTSEKLTVALTLLGGIAGIWSVVKYAISLQKKG